MVQQGYLDPHEASTVVRMEEEDFPYEDEGETRRAKFSFTRASRPASNEEPPCPAHAALSTFHPGKVQYITV